MADRAQPVSTAPGKIVAAGVAAIIFGALVAVALRAETGRGLGAPDWAALRFTVLQATLSAVFSVALAIPVARALARRRFKGRRVLIALLGAPFILPVIVAVLGLIAVFGRAGWVSNFLGLFGLPPVQISSTCLWPHASSCKAGRKFPANGFVWRHSLVWMAGPWCG